MTGGLSKEKDVFFLRVRQHQEAQAQSPLLPGAEGITMLAHQKTKAKLGGRPSHQQGGQCR